MKTSFSGANMAEYTWWWPCLLPPTRPVQSYKKLMPKQQFIHKVNSKGSLYGWAAAIESTGTGLLGGGGRGYYHVCTATDWRQEWKIAVLDTIFHFLASAINFFLLMLMGLPAVAPSDVFQASSECFSQSSRNLFKNGLWAINESAN